MPTSLGTIPEDLPSNEVYSVALASLPTSVTGRRANFEELIWDADGGFAPEWIGRSSISGSGPYTMLLQRSSFTAAGLALFSYAALGGGVTLAGDVTGPSGTNTVGKILGATVPALSNGALTSTGGVLSWAAGGGSGDVVGPASAVADRIATFDGITGKLIKDGGQTIAQVIAAATPAQEHYSGWNTTASASYTSTSFAGLVSGFPSWSDAIQSGITRAGSVFTVTAGGLYQINVHASAYDAGSQYWTIRALVAGVTVWSVLRYGNSEDVSIDSSCVVQVGAGGTITLEYAITGGTFNYSGGALTVGGEQARAGSITICRVGT